MEQPGRMSLKKVWTIFLVLLHLALIAGLAIFILNQQKALRQARETALVELQNAAPLSLAQATLPRAMTATPKTAESQEIVLTDSEMTEGAQEQADQADLGMPVKIETVRFTPGQVNISGTIDVAGAQGQFEMVGVLYAEDNRLRMKLDSFTVAGQAMPESTFAEIENQMNDFLEQSFTGLDIQSVELEQGQMRMTVVPW